VHTHGRAREKRPEFMGKKDEFTHEKRVRAKHKYKDKIRFNIKTCVSPKIIPPTKGDYRCVR
jgi:hypothetical protein